MTSLYMYTMYLIISILIPAFLSNPSYSPWLPPTNSPLPVMVFSSGLYAVSSVGAAQKYVSVRPPTGS